MFRLLGFLSKAVCVACWGALIYSVGFRYGPFAGAIMAGLSGVVAWAMTVRVPPRHGAIICNWRGGHREIGAGLHLLRRPYEWVDTIRLLDKADLKFSVQAETQKGDQVTVWLAVGVRTLLAFLNESLLFGSSTERFRAVQNRIESLVTYLISRCDTYRDIYAGKGGIEDGLLSFFKTEQADGRSLEAYYATSLAHVTISDIVPRDDVREAAALKRIQEEKGKALHVAVSDYHREAKRLLRGNPELDKTRVMELLMAQTGVIPQKIKVNRIEVGGLAQEIRRILGDSVN
ncbi:MAG: hypothetical protein G01um101419_442 [Parcubacteria group bacterium Gr01-1014_19]|nr:MAG: hypothetical protein G01um101419_442 [Parcubacteria group bacterium Gr01-1014_19]